MQTIAVTNLKGGVGKTATTLGLAAAAGARDRNVLVIDLDPQANATLALAPDLDPEHDLTINDVLLADAPGSISQAIRPTAWPGVSLVGAQLELDSRESDNAANSTHRLRRALRGLTGYELVLIDCRPSVGRLTTNALVAATSALVVTDAERSAIRGISAAIEHVRVVAEDLNPSLTLAGILVNRFDGRLSEARFRLDEIERLHPNLVWAPPIPARTAVAQAFGAGVPVSDIGGEAADEISAVYAAHLDRLMEGPANA